MTQGHRHEWANPIDDLESIRADMARLVEESADVLCDVHPEQHASARLAQDADFRARFEREARASRS